MVLLNFLYAALIIGLTITAFLTGQDGDARGLLFYAGALLICACFSLKSRRHGLIGGAVLASLALFSLSSRLWTLIRMPDPAGTPAFVINLLATIGSGAFLFCCFAYWQRRKRLAPPPEENESA